jgi:2-polyprenyl-3-methyl-5-hydroxy-6-metoxy-1,4-benzoquinol methylase
MNDTNRVSPSKILSQNISEALEKRVNNSLVYSTCPLCKSKEIEKIGQVKYFKPTIYASNQVLFENVPEFWKCHNCLSGFLQNIISEQESINLYSQQDAYVPPAKIGSFEKLKPQALIEFLQVVLKPNLKILDIGCNDGLFLDFAKLNHCQTSGVEYSLSCQKFLRQKGHITYSRFEDVRESYDLITAFDLVEHLYDLPSFIEKCLVHLKPNGYIVFHTGDILSLLPRLIQSNWWYLRYPEHIVFPSKKYFISHPQVVLDRWIPTYANTHYQSITNLVKFLTKELFINDFSGAHWLIPDHALIVLRAKELRNNV